MIDRTAIKNAQRDEAFRSVGWITFYLRGDPMGHAAMEPGLIELKATNLGSGDSGCVYAKVPVLLKTAEIEDRISQVRHLAAEADIEIDIIDLDASPNIKRSKFYTLWTAPPD